MIHDALFASSEGVHPHEHFPAGVPGEYNDKIAWSAGPLTLVGRCRGLAKGAEGPCGLPLPLQTGPEELPG